MNENKSEQELQIENLANQETSAVEGGELYLSIEEQLAQATQKLTEMQDSFLRAKAEGGTSGGAQWKTLQKHTNLRSKALQST